MGKEYATKRPCSECPFRRDYPVEELRGRVDPLRLIGQGHAAFWLPCHMDPEYQGAGHCDVSLAQCAGAGVYRANVGIGDKTPEYLHRLPLDTETVFASPEELLAHHLGIPLEEAKDRLEQMPPIAWTIREITRAGAGKVMAAEAGARAGDGREIDNADLRTRALTRMLHDALEAEAAGARVFPPDKLRG